MCGLAGVSKKRFTHFGRDFWKVVDVFHGVFAIGDDEAKLKVKTLEQGVFEEVLLDHAQVLHWLVTYLKLHTVQEKRQ